MSGMSRKIALVVWWSEWSNQWSDWSERSEWTNRESVEQNDRTEPLSTNKPSAQRAIKSTLKHINKSPSQHKAAWQRFTKATWQHIHSVMNGCFEVDVMNAWCWGWVSQGKVGEDALGERWSWPGKLEWVGGGANSFKAVLNIFRIQIKMMVVCLVLTRAPRSDSWAWERGRHRRPTATQKVEHPNLKIVL